MDWSEIATWPNGQFSRRLPGPVHRWHVQEAGSGQTLLLLHGAGGSTHSWRDVFTDLARTHHVVALDLPGHGFTQLGAQLRSGLDPMATDIAALCAQEGWAPGCIVGHSAGGAIALRMGQMRALGPDMQPALVGVNAALGNFKGLAGLLFPMMAKMLAAMPFTASMFAGSAGQAGRVEALLEATGSTLSEEGVALYRRLIADRAHVDGALKMMAQWSLTRLLHDLDTVPAGTVLVVGTEDRTVPPETSREMVDRLREARLIELEGLGHLAHEEAPGQLAEIVREAAG